MSGFIDLHCHPVPAVDDGCKSIEEGAALVAALGRAGFARVVATPHIRSGAWDNRRETLAEPFAALTAAVDAMRATDASVPTLELAAEHLFDDVTWELFASKNAMPYPGGRAALVEFSYENLPVRVEQRLWRLCKLGVTPVIAHPERCALLTRDEERLLDVKGSGAKLSLDLMSLVGAYGRGAQSAAERWLKAGYYTIACSDSHKPSDVERVLAAIEALRAMKGDEGVRALLIDGPNSLIGAAQ